VPGASCTPELGATNYANQIRVRSGGRHGHLNCQGFNSIGTNLRAGTVAHRPDKDDDMVVPVVSTFDSPVPPAGTKVRILTLSGGGLQSRMEVKERFT
jgi:hypothetical protein